MTDKVTTIEPFALLVVLGLGVLFVILPRRYAIIPFLAGACFITVGQQIVFIGLTFTMIRMLVLFGWARMFVKRDFFTLKLNEVDMIFAVWVSFAVFNYILLYFNSDAVINRLGFAFDAIGIYFIIRFLTSDMEDIKVITLTLSVFAIVMAAFMIIEQVSGRNIFSIFGGVPEFSVIRDGAIRCQGPFGHPILAGTFGVVVLPYSLTLLLYNEKNRIVLGIVCAISATLMTILSSSSGPFLAYLFVFMGLAAWVIRGYLKPILWGSLLCVIVLHVFMNAPVWYLIGRASELVGGMGWHRSELINQAIGRIDEWWLIGTTQTDHWMRYSPKISEHMMDITNQYIYEGVNGGLITLASFIAVIAFCFRKVGKEIKSYRSKNQDKMIWCLGVSLLGHVVSFLSVTYYDQMNAIYYLSVALIASIPYIAEEEGLETEV